MVFVLAIVLPLLVYASNTASPAPADDEGFWKSYAETMFPQCVHSEISWVDWPIPDDIMRDIEESCRAFVNCAYLGKGC
nr:hypothetical protein Iba_chr14bCG7390 [Ipomoea batatas]